MKFKKLNLCQKEAKTLIIDSILFIVIIGLTLYINPHINRLELLFLMYLLEFYIFIKTLNSVKKYFDCSNS